MASPASGMHSKTSAPEPTGNDGTKDAPRAANRAFVLAFCGALGAIAAGMVFLPTLAPILGNETFSQSTANNAICDGLYCGGPFHESMAFALIVPMALFGAIGLIIVAIKARQAPTTAPLGRTGFPDPEEGAQ